MLDERFARVAVVGTGMMGPGIALTLARGGCRVALYGRTEASKERGLARVDGALAFLVEHGVLDAREAPALRAQIRGTTDLKEAVDGAGLVQESIVEDLEMKRALFRQLEALCAPQTLLTSDTSGLRISDIVADLARPERTATLHYWNPPHLMPLVEITQGERTAAETVDALVELMRRCGLAPVVARRDVPGQIGNRLQHALLREALYMVQEGIASPADIDLALKMGPGRRWPVYGVLEHSDVVGMDLVLAIQRSLVPALCNSPEPLPLLDEMTRRGELGVKAGRGLYDWSERDADAVKERRDAFLCALARGWEEGRDATGRLQYVPGGSPRLRRGGNPA
jgi:3-hydroxybutyryl-CoA dehydrogenase